MNENSTASDIHRAPDTLHQRLHEHLLAAGFEYLHDQMYRGTADLTLEPGRRHNVFASLAEPLTFMALIGPAADIQMRDLEAVRTPNDGCSTGVVADSGALLFPIPHQLVDDPVELIQSATRLANYTAWIGDELARRQKEKEDLLARIQGVIDPTGWDRITSGIISEEAFVKDVERVLLLIPERGLWAQISTFCTRANLDVWSRTPGGMLDSAWGRISERVRSYGTDRGWEITEDD